MSSGVWDTLGSAQRLRGVKQRGRATILNMHHGIAGSLTEDILFHLARMPCGLGHTSMNLCLFGLRPVMSLASFLSLAQYCLGQVDSGWGGGGDLTAKVPQDKLIERGLAVSQKAWKAGRRQKALVGSVQRVLDIDCCTKAEKHVLEDRVRRQCRYP